MIGDCDGGVVFDNLVSLGSSVKDVSLEPEGRGGSEVIALDSCSQGGPSSSSTMLDRTSSQCECGCYLAKPK